MLSIAFVSAIAYGFYLAHGLFSPPNVVISTPDAYMKSYSSHVTLQGKAEHAKEVSINGDTIILSKDGTFIESFNLPDGITILRIDAKSRLGKTTTVYRIVAVDNNNRTLVLKAQK